MKKFSLLFLSISSLFLCSQQKINSSTINNQAKLWVDSTYNSLSLDDKIAQLFMVAAYVNKGQEHIEEINRLVLDEHIGGLILMQDDVTKQANWVQSLQNKVKVPLLIGIDGEWGLAQRFIGIEKFPWAMTLGAITQDSLIYEMGREIALHCTYVGINWDFAPVVDINTNPKNPIIGNRSFGSNKYNIEKKAIAYMKGLQSRNILSSAKHFPGHGDTEVDSHLDLPVLNHSLVRLDSLELYPFKKLIENNVDGIMVAHLNVPALEKDTKIPASLSYNIITGLLKNKLGYKGLIITDALNMQGIAKNFPYGEMDYLAFKAGNDILLFSQGVAEGKEKIKNAILSGEISEDRLKESVKKILYAKYNSGLNEHISLSTDDLLEKINNKHLDDLNKKLYESAITELKSSKKYFPLTKKKKYLYLPLEDGDYSVFYSNLKKEFPTLTKITLRDLKEKKYNPNKYELIIGIHKDTDTTLYYSPLLSEETQTEIVKLSKDYSVTICNFISPYSLNNLNLSSVKNIIITYQNNNYTQEGIMNILNGNKKAIGKLPVELLNEK